MSLPPNWAIISQPAPRNHGTPAIDALRPGQPLRELVGDMLADAAIARAEKIGLPKYGSYATPNNGRDDIVDGMQELPDAATYFTSAILSVQRDQSEESVLERRYLKSALVHLRSALVFADLAASQRSKRFKKAKRAKRLAKAKGEKE